MFFEKRKDYTPEELEKISLARKEEAIMAGYYRPKYHKQLRSKTRRTKR